LPQVGVRRSGERGLPDTRAHAAPPRQASLQRFARRKGHAKAIGAVARDLAEATYWMLSNEESYREPKASRRLVHGGSARRLHELPEARPSIATSPEMTIMPLRTAEIWLRRNGTMRGGRPATAALGAEAMGEPAAPGGAPRLDTESESDRLRPLPSCRDPSRNLSHPDGRGCGGLGI